MKSSRMAGRALSGHRNVAQQLNTLDPGPGRLSGIQNDPIASSPALRPQGDAAAHRSRHGNPSGGATGLPGPEEDESAPLAC